MKFNIFKKIRKPECRHNWDEYVWNNGYLPIISEFHRKCEKCNKHQVYVVRVRRWVNLDIYELLYV